jgi:hypothetical protein
MHPTTHLLAGWLIANTGGLNKRERALVAIAGAVPDLDGLGMIAEIATRNSPAPLLWWSKYHHILCHNLSFGLLYAAVAFGLATRRWRTAGLTLISFHLHILGDLCGGRGPDGDQWPIPYLYPFSEKLQLAWSHQWFLNAWPNFFITGLALFLTFYLAWKRGFSPLEIISRRADKAVVDTLRTRFPLETSGH